MHTPPAGHGASSSSQAANRNLPLFDARYHVSFIMVTALFFLWAVPNNLNDVLIRQFMKSFQISRLQAGLVQSAFYLGYFCLSMPAAFVLRRFGYRIGLVSGLLLYALGCLLFWPAAEVQRYAFFLVALFIIAAGLAFLETGAGAFITLLGVPETSERRLNLAQAFNPPGSITGALIGTVFIFSGLEPSAAQLEHMKAAGQYAAFLRSETLRVIAPYLVIGAIVFFFAMALLRVSFPPKMLAREESSHEGHGAFGALLRTRHFVWAVIAQFLYVGAQVGTWSYLIQYVQEYTHSREKTAGYFLTGTLILFAVGRFVATYLMKYITPTLLMGIYALINVVLLIVGVGLPGWIGLWALMFSSFFMSLMYPTIFALGLKRLGPHATLGASLIVMSIAGGAVITPLMGWIAGRAETMAPGYLVPLFCYMVVAYFAFWGSRIPVSQTEIVASEGLHPGPV